MFNLHAIYLFIFVFTTLVLLKNITKIIIALLPKDPKPIVYGKWEIIFLGLSISYIITYIISI
jgi:hypothetical protein